MRSKKKVLAYIFRTNGAHQEILVFDHLGMPEAGTQVIGGTVEETENLAVALSREIFEEAGLKISPNRFKKLGESTYYRKDIIEQNERTYFEVTTKLGELPDYFEHTVISDGEDNGLVFVHFWITVENAKKRLTGNFHELL